MFADLVPSNEPVLSGLVNFPKAQFIAEFLLQAAPVLMPTECCTLAHRQPRFQPYWKAKFEWGIWNYLKEDLYTHRH